MLPKDWGTGDTEKKEVEICTIPLSGLGTFISTPGKGFPTKAGFTHQNSLT